jgi:hypothetical protein
MNLPGTVSCLAGSHPEARFGHLTIYAATYYSYVYARVLASSTWSKLFADDPLNPAAGGYQVWIICSCVFRVQDRGKSQGVLCVPCVCTQLLSLGGVANPSLLAAHLQVKR